MNQTLRKKKFIKISSLFLLILTLFLPSYTAFSDINVRIKEYEDMVEKGQVEGVTVYINLNLTWSEIGSGNMSGMGNITLNAVLQEQATIRARIYNIPRMHDGKNGVIIPEMKIYTTPVSYSMNYLNTIDAQGGFTYNKMYLKKSEVPTTIVGSPTEYGKPDLFTLAIYPGSWAIILEAAPSFEGGSAQTKGMSPGTGTILQEAKIDDVRIDNISFNDLKGRALEWKIDVPVKKEMNNYGHVYTDEVTVRGTVRISTKSNYCEPLGGMWLGKDYEIVDFPQDREVHLGSISGYGENVRIEFNGTHWNSLSRSSKNAVARHELVHKKQFMAVTGPSLSSSANEDFDRFMKEYDAYFEMAMFIHECVDLSNEKPEDARDFRAWENLIYTKDGQFRPLSDVQNRLENEFGYNFK